MGHNSIVTLLLYLPSTEVETCIGLPVTAKPVCVSVSVPFIPSSDFYSAGGQTRDVDTFLV